jgi:hypothetical protein
MLWCCIKRRKTEDCAICMEVIHSDFCQLACTHIFHSKCVQKWKIISKTCPVCRSDIVCVNHLQHDDDIRDFIITNQDMLIKEQKKTIQEQLDVIICLNIQRNEYCAYLFRINQNQEE